MPLPGPSGTEVTSLLGICLNDLMFLIASSSDVGVSRDFT